MSKRFLLMLAVAIILGVPLLGFFNSRRLYQENSGVFTNNGTFKGRRMAGPAMPSVRYEDQTLAQNDAMYEVQPGVVPPSSFTEPSSYGMPGTSDGFTATQERIVTRNAQMSLVVSDTRQTVTKIMQLMSDNQGFVTSSNIYDTEDMSGAVTADMILRLPVAQLDEAMAKLRGLAEKVTAETVMSSDRTEQKIDLVAQIANLQATEAQLVRIMAQATTVTQTLEVQKELSNTRGQIERLQAQVENLTGDAEMATISINISTKEAGLPLISTHERSIFDEVKIASRDAVRLYRDLFVGGLRLTILALPLLVIGGVIYLIAKRAR